MRPVGDVGRHNVRSSSRSRSQKAVTRWDSLELLSRTRPEARLLAGGLGLGRGGGLAWVGGAAATRRSSSAPRSRGLALILQRPGDDGRGGPRRAGGREGTGWPGDAASLPHPPVLEALWARDGGRGGECKAAGDASERGGGEGRGAEIHPTLLRLARAACDLFLDAWLLDIRMVARAAPALWCVETERCCRLYSKSSNHWPPPTAATQPPGPGGATTPTM